MWKRNDIVETVNHASKEASTVSVLKRGTPTWRPQSSAGHLCQRCALLQLGVKCSRLRISLWLCWIFVAVQGLSLAVALARGLSSCGTWAYLYHGVWNPPGAGTEPVSSASAGRLTTTGPPGKFMANDFCFEHYF